MKSQNLSFFKLGLLSIITAVVAYAPSAQAATSNAKQTFAVEEISAKRHKGEKKGKARKENKERVRKEKIAPINAKCRHHREEGKPGRARKYPKDEKKVALFHAKKEEGKPGKVRKHPKHDNKKRHPHEGGAPQ